MKIKKITPAVISLIVAFNLTASVIIITKGYKTVRYEKPLKQSERAQTFLTSIVC